MYRKNLDTIVQRALTSALGLTLMTSTAAYASDVELDLSSTSQTVTVTSAHLEGLTSAPIQVNGGASTVNISQGDTVTAAQFIAVLQVVNPDGTFNLSNQTLHVNTGGAATHGHFEMSTLPVSISNFTIPGNVIAVANQVADLNISGNLNTSGVLFGFQNNGMAPTFNLGANNITVGSTGAITTFVPGAIQNLYSQLNSQVNMSILANGCIDNSGFIKASGTLNMVANTIMNSGTIASGNSMSLTSTLGSITNSGFIRAYTGNLNIQSLIGTDLLVGNIGGTIRALAGDLNIGNYAAGSVSNTKILGGILGATDHINLTAGNGMLTSNTEELLGLVDIKAAGAHVSVAQGDLRMDTVDLTGDPVFVAMDGSIKIINYLSGTNGAPLTMAASEDILLGNGVDINTSSNSGSGGNVTLIAGFQIVGNDSNNDHEFESYTLTAPSLLGGDIFAPMSTIDTSSTAGNGGNVTLIAHEGDLGLGGFINVGAYNFGPSINTGTTAANGEGGSITAIGQYGVALPGWFTVGPQSEGEVNITMGEPEMSSPVTLTSTGGFIGQFNPIVMPAMDGDDPDYGYIPPPNLFQQKPPLNGPLNGTLGGGEIYGPKPAPTGGGSGTVTNADTQQTPINISTGPKGNHSNPVGQAPAGDNDGPAVVPKGPGNGPMNGAGPNNAVNAQAGAQGDDGGPVVHTLVSGDSGLRSSSRENTLPASTNSIRAVGAVSINRAADNGMVNVTQNQLRMTLVTRSNQILSGNLGGRGNFMMASEGTTYTNQQGVVILHSGRLHASSGPDGAMIVANGQRVSIAPNSSAVVSVTTRGAVSISQVGGNQAGVSVSSPDGAALAMNPGDMVHMSDDLSSDDLIDVNGQFEPVSAGITHFGGQKKMVKKTIAVERYLEDELLPATRSMNLGTSARTGRNRFLSNVAAAARRQNPSYSVPSPASMPNSVAEKSTQSGTIDLFSAEGTQLQRVSDGNIKLLSGMVMLRAPGETTVQTEFAKVSADRGALFAVEQQDGITRVRALSGPGDTTVIAGDKSIQLNPGEEVTLSAHNLKRSELNPADGIGRRTAKPFRIAGFYAAIADFSIASFIHGDQRLRDFIGQGDGMFDGLLKTAVAVEMVTAPRGRYTSTPKATAFAAPEEQSKNLVIASERK